MYIVGRKLEMNKKEQNETEPPVPAQYSIYQEEFHDNAEDALVAYNKFLFDGYRDAFIAKMLLIKTVLIDFDGTELPLTLGVNKR